MQVFIIIGVCYKQTGIYLLSVAFFSSFSFDIRYNIRFFVGLVGWLMGGFTCRPINH